MRRVRLLVTLILAGLIAFPALALAQEGGSLEIVEVNTSRYDEGGNVTMVLGVRNAPANLDPEQVSVTADGNPVENLTVEPLASSTVPVGVILAIDTSGSMEGEPIEAARAAAQSFVEQKRPEDFVAILTFDDEVRVLQGFTNNTDTLLARIDTIEAAGATAFNDAVVRSINMFSDPSASQLQPNVIVLADGADNGSNASAAEVQAAIGESDVRIFGVALEAPDFEPDAVQQFAQASGGLFMLAPSPDELSGLFGQIQAEINNVLVARFTVPQSSPGELAFNVSYADLSADASAQVPGFVTTTSAGSATTAQTFPEAQAFVVEDGLPASPQTIMLIGALGAGAALGLFIWILFGRKDEEGGGAFQRRLQAYGRRGGGQEEAPKSLLDRLPLLRRFSQAAEE